MELMKVIGHKTMLIFFYDTVKTFSENPLYIKVKRTHLRVVTLTYPIQMQIEILFDGLEESFTNTHENENFILVYKLLVTKLRYWTLQLYFQNLSY